MQIQMPHQDTNLWTAEHAAIKATYINYKVLN